MSPKIEDIRFSLSSIDEFFSPRPRVANMLIGKIRVSNLNQLAGFEFVSDDQLIRLSKQDFWKLGQDGEGHFIERLVCDDDGPVRES
jgi:hypothetical protein